MPEALTTYEELRIRWREDLGTDPGPDLQALHLRLLRGEPDPALMVTSGAAPPPSATRRSSLRAALTSFVGRDDDLRRVLSGLRSHRLTTVLDTGGCGKTRLAAEVGRRWLAEDAEASVWLVELVPVTGADDLVTAVLGALGVRDPRVTERTDRPLSDARERLLDRLRDSQCLLVMDNCEHLIDPVAQLVDDILAVAPQARVLATSRELLGLTGELLGAIAHQQPIRRRPSDRLTPGGHQRPSRRRLCRPDAARWPQMARTQPARGPDATRWPPTAGSQA